MAKNRSLPPFLRLPLELRQQIYSYILPDLPIIETTIDERNQGYLEKERHHEYLSRAYEYAFTTPRRDRRDIPLRYDRQRSSIDVLCVSRQVYEEATAYLYSRTFVISVSAVCITFLMEEYQSLPWCDVAWNNGREPQYRLIYYFDRQFPISRVRELMIRVNAPIIETPRSGSLELLYEEFARHMISVCELLRRRCRKVKSLPKITVELPPRFVKGMAFDDGYENIRPACIENALRIMRDTVSRVKGCRIMNVEDWEEVFPDIARLAEECQRAVVMEEDASL